MWRLVGTEAKRKNARVAHQSNPNRKFKIVMANVNTHSSLSSNGTSRCRERIVRSVVQSATRRAKLCATSNRSNGSRVQSNLRAWPTRVSREISSMINRLSFMTVLVNSGLLTESRPTSAKNWISRNETGDTPHGRYRSSQGKLAKRFDSRTSQIRKWVSRRSVTFLTAGVKPGGALGHATPTTTDLPHRHAAPSGFFYTVRKLWRSSFGRVLPGATRFVGRCARLQSLHLGAHHRAIETNVFWLLMPSRSSHVQCTRQGAMSQCKNSEPVRGQELT
jgi:hypothetical protein